MAGSDHLAEALSILRCSRWQSTWVRFRGGLMLGMGRSGNAPIFNGVRS
jgi:hypothetical protein